MNLIGDLEKIKIALMAKQSTSAQADTDCGSGTSELELTLMMDCIELNSPPQMFLRPMDCVDFDGILCDGFQLEPSLRRKRSKSDVFSRRMKPIRKLKRKTSENVGNCSS